MRLSDGPGDRHADGNSDTVRHRHALGHLDSPHSLDWHLSALTVNLLLTRSGGGGGNSMWSSGSSSGGSSSLWGPLDEHNPGLLPGDLLGGQ